MINLDTIARFTWSYGPKFHLETTEGNFEWSDPDYTGGDNTIQPTKPYSEWCKDKHIQFGRDKGKHTIRDYCGEDVKFVNCGIK